MASCNQSGRRLVLRSQPPTPAGEGLGACYRGREGQLRRRIFIAAAFSDIGLQVRGRRRPSGRPPILRRRPGGRPPILRRRLRLRLSGSDVAAAVFSDVGSDVGLLVGRRFLRRRLGGRPPILRRRLRRRLSGSDVAAAVFSDVGRPSSDIGFLAPT